MKFYKIFLFIFVFLSSTPKWLNAQKTNSFSKYYYDIEWVTIGSELLSGDISELLKPGIHASFLNFHVGLKKYPSFTLGLTLLDSGSHDFKANDSEQNIIDQYVIIKTTTDRSGNTTTEMEKLEKIRLTRFNFGLPISYQKLGVKKPINYQISLIPSIYNFSTNMPKEGTVEVKDKVSFGIALKVAADYQFKKAKKSGRYLRLSYGLYTIPDLDMPLLPGIRHIQGTGLAHAIQLGFGVRNLTLSE